MENQELVSGGETVREGGAAENKSHGGRRRPRHNRHNRGKQNRDKQAEGNLNAGDATATEVAAQAPKADNGNTSGKDQAKSGRNQKGEQKGNQRGEKKTEPSTDKKSADGQDKPSAPQPQRQQRVPHPIKKPTKNDLPAMDNLLIEDCPADSEMHEDGAVDPADIERILSRDPFVHQHISIPNVIPEGKVIIVGIRFRTGGKTYFFTPGSLTCKAGQYAVVETARGMEFGEICIGNRMVDESMVVPPLRPVIRIATEADIQQNELNHQREEEAYRIGSAKIAEHKLDMKLVSVQYTFDNSKLLFYFTSAGRVDFRELVKDLAGVFHIRIELRQIGIRDEARMLGGLGTCGRPLCCSTFLSDFGQVSMKMAKEQNLSLNSTKISGCCGRLMCCLRYEHETYAEEIRRTPSVGTFVSTPDGPGVVAETAPLLGEVKVRLKNDPEAAPKKYHRSTLTTQAGHGRNDNRPAQSEDAEPDTDE